MPTVLGEAPLGTYVGWNLATTGWYGPNASNGPGSVGQVFAGAGNSGGYWPFWDTRANRLAAGDPRPSLEERYGTHAGYVCVVTRAVNKAVAAALPASVRGTDADCQCGCIERTRGSVCANVEGQCSCQFAVHQYEVPKVAQRQRSRMADRGNPIRHLFCGAQGYIAK